MRVIEPFKLNPCNIKGFHVFCIFLEYGWVDFCIFLEYGSGDFCIFFELRMSLFVRFGKVWMRALRHFHLVHEFAKDEKG